METELEIGNFNLGNPFSDLDLLNSIFEEEWEPTTFGSNATSVSEANREMDLAMTDPLQPVPSLAMPSTNRFKKISEEEMEKIKECRTSDSTKRNTKWGVKIFQEWCLEVHGTKVDFKTVSAETLNEYLSKFYFEATPKNPGKRSGDLPMEQAAEYHKNSFKSIRSAINRHLKDINRDLDIVRGREFKTANENLDGKLKFNLQNGLSRPVAHKPIIPQSDLVKICTYLWSDDSPVILRFRVWYSLSLHFVSRGLEFHQQLKTNSFLFQKDENGKEYVTLSHDTKQKNWQGGLDNPENDSDKRMYANESADGRCPVTSLKLFLDKTDPSATALFNHCTAASLKNKNEEIWYSNKPVKPYLFRSYLPDICKNSKLVQRFTCHSLRATAIQHMNDSGYEARHIMYMSGHRSESSVRSYNRQCSTLQKKSLSNTLSILSSNACESDAIVPVLPARPQPFIPLQIGSSISPESSAQTVVHSQNSVSLHPSNFQTSGFMSNSTFNHCTFQFANN